MMITLDQEVVLQECAECEVLYTVVRGSVFGDGEPVGLYLIGLHGHSPEGRVAQLAIGVSDHLSGEPRAYAAAIRVFSTPGTISSGFIPWDASPWQDETYLGAMLTPTEVRASNHRDTFTEIGRQVVTELQKVWEYITDQVLPPGAFGAERRRSGSEGWPPKCRGSKVSRSAPMTPRRG